LVKWIKITTDILNDNKMKLIDTMPEADAIFRIWVGILTLAGQCNDSGMVYLAENMPYTDEMLATIFNRPVNVIRLALDTLAGFKIIEILENGVLFITNWEKHQDLTKLEKIREQTRRRVAKHREKAKQLPCNVTVTESNATDKIRLDKTRKEKEYIDFFQKKIWPLYPFKKGGRTATQKHFLARVNEGAKTEDLLIAVKNYARLKHNTEKAYILNGATFFGPNERWAEYLEIDPAEFAPDYIKKILKKHEKERSYNELAMLSDWKRDQKKEAE